MNEFLDAVHCFSVKFSSVLIYVYAAKICFWQQLICFMQNLLCKFALQQRVDNLLFTHNEGFLLNGMSVFNQPCRRNDG